MLIAERLRALRQNRNLSQGDIEKRTGLLRSYISRVENGHTVPAIETLEKLARAIEVPLYQIFCEDKAPSKLPYDTRRTGKSDSGWGSSGKDARTFEHFRTLLSRIEARDRVLLIHMVQKMARRSRNRTKA
jgi:transcriptional regulator with XRE-family HTH domain